MKLFLATNVLWFDSHKVKERVVFQSRSLADVLISACIINFISTFVCPALKRYGSFKFNIGRSIALVSLRSWVTVNPTECPNIFSRVLTGQLLNTQPQRSFLNLSINIIQILAADSLDFLNDSFCYMFPDSARDYFRC